MMRPWPPTNPSPDCARSPRTCRRSCARPARCRATRRASGSGTWSRSWASSRSRSRRWGGGPTGRCASRCATCAPRASSPSSRRESATLALWIDEKKRAAERWAADEPVQREAAALVRLAQGGMDAAAVCRSPARRKLLAQIAPVRRPRGGGGGQPHRPRRRHHRRAPRRVLRPHRGRRRVREAPGAGLRGADGVRAALRGARSRGRGGEASRSTSPWSGWRRRCAAMPARSSRRWASGAWRTRASGRSSC